MTTIELKLFSQKYLPPNELIIIECAGHSHAYAYIVQTYRPRMCESTVVRHKYSAP